MGRSSDGQCHRHHTVWFNSFVTLYDGITLEVIRIIQVWKKPFIGNSLAFYTKQFSGIFYRSLIHFTPWGALDQIMQKRLFFSFFSTNYIHRQFSLSIFINYIRISYIWNLSGMKISKFCKEKSNIRKYFHSLKDIITYFAKNYF